MAFQGCHGAKYRGQTLMIMDLATMAHPPKNHSKLSQNGISGQNFLRLRRAKRGFAYGTVLDNPGSATLVGTLIPVGSEGWCPPRDK